MKRNIGKIVKRISVGILITLVSFLFLWVFEGIIESFLFGYWYYNTDNKLEKNRYEKIFKENYFKEMGLSTIVSSRLDGFIYYYTYNNSEIYIMESARFSKIEIQDFNVNNYLIKDKDVYGKSRGHFWSKAVESPINISFYINYGKAKQADVYIDSPPEKMDRGDDYLYVKFKSAGVIISSTNKYPELKFNCGQKKLAFELMILKKDDKNLIILKYPLGKDREDFGVSLKDIINISGGLSLSENSYDTAMEGGKHSGFLNNYLNKPAQEIQNGINSLQKQILEHNDKITNPSKYIEKFCDLDFRQRLYLINNKWPGDIARRSEQLQILRDLLKRM